MPMFNILLESATPPLIQTRAGIQGWVWVLIFVIAVAIVWILLSIAAKTEEPQIESHHEEQHTSHEEVLEETPKAADDLTRLEGIGPKVSQVLKSIGIETFAQLAEADTTAIQEVLDANGLQFMNPGSWPQQAKLASEGKWDELAKLQDELKGGVEG